jgi:hypothetical protein
LIAAIDELHQSFDIAKLRLGKPFLKPIGLPHEIACSRSVTASARAAASALRVLFSRLRGLAN